MHSVVSMRLATLPEFTRAVLTTFVGSTMPLSFRYT